MTRTLCDQRLDPQALEALWAHHHAELRDPHQIVSQWHEASEVEPGLLEYEVSGDWWDVLEQTALTLIVTREYEHLLMAFCVEKGKPRISFLRLPHPNGLAADRARGLLHVASTRNPNIVFDFAPCAGLLNGDAHKKDTAFENVLLPVRARYLPGKLYIHDLALIGGKLYANAVGLNAVVRLPESGGFAHAWWPQCIDGDGQPLFDKNYLQLNSIAPGKTLEGSFFSASARRPSARRPGHRNFPVDRRGVIFSGKTREVCATGLTRPHSARLYNRELWVDNSGYGEVGRIVKGRFEAVLKLPGWTRGLAFHKDLAFVGTSRVIPRFQRYAPGVAPARSRCGLHAIDVKSGRVLGGLVWPRGNQVFAIEVLNRQTTRGFPFSPQNDAAAKAKTRIFFRGLPQIHTGPRSSVATGSPR